MAAFVAGFVGFLAAAPEPRASPSPVARSPAPLSNYQRAKLEQYRSSAPADQYFGRQKLSFLGINNTFRDAAISAGDHTVDPAIVSKIGFADDALRDWASHFPHDPQLARTYFLAIRAHRKIWLKPEQETAWVYMNRITTLFPTSYFGKLTKADMAIGFTEHYYAEAVPCPAPTATPTLEATQTPTVVASVVPKARPGRSKATPTPAPTATPTPTPTETPSPAPTPAPTPRTIAKGLAVQIEASACVAVAAPSNTPRPAPTLAPAPAPAIPPESPHPPAAAPTATPVPPVPKSSPSARPT